MKSCRTCGFAKDNMCQLLKFKLLDGDHACPFHEKEPQFCAFCGKVLLPSQGVYLPEFEKYVCADCSELAYTCLTCRHKPQDPPACIASKYHGPLDIMIQVTGRKGVFQVTTNHINPKVIEQVCPTCTCGSPWFCRRLRTCEHWEAPGI